jgi:hypothetical protein
VSVGTSSVSGADRSVLAGSTSSASASGSSSSSSQNSGSTSTSAASPAAPRSPGVGSSDTVGNLDQKDIATVVVSVKNSTDLNTLVEGLTLAQAGESLLFEGNTYTRRPGTISVDAGTFLNRNLTLRNNVITADVIKARGFQQGGRDSLVIEGGQFNATQTIKLYGEGVSTLRFRGAVQLNAPQSDLAGSRVAVDAGSTVTATGNVRVYSDDHAYNRPGSGTLTAPTTQSLPHASRPRF